MKNRGIFCWLVIGLFSFSNDIFSQESEVESAESSESIEVSGPAPDLFQGDALYGKNDQRSDPAAATAPSGAKNIHSIDLYRGLPRVSLPLYNIKTPDITVPISLNYSISQVKPDLHPGMMGLGWNLNCGGSIVRKQRLFPEESRCTFTGTRMNEKDTRLSSYYWDGIHEEPGGLGYAVFDMYMGDPYDIEMDEFSFHFLGYSGTFYRDQNGEWTIISDTDFKIDHKIGRTGDIPRFSNAHSIYWELPILESFRLTDVNGIRYTFGGDPLAIDLVGPYFHNARVATPVATQWHLTRIDLPCGQSVLFKYEESSPNCEVKTGFDMTLRDIYPTYAFNLILPVRLQSIDISGNKVEFEYQETAEKSIPTSFLNGTGLRRDLRAYSGYFISSFDKVKWHRLSRIKIGDLSYNFYYTNDTRERSKLLRIDKNFEKLGTDERYRFDYYDKKLPDYYSGYYDNLGFYNGISDDGFFDTFFLLNISRDELKQWAQRFENSRKPDSTGTFLCAELLKSVTYPTGGSSVFEYEPNIVGARVDTVRSLEQPLVNGQMYSGGARIKSVREYIEPGELAYTKKYYYTSNYHPNAKNGNSSGILSYTPVYMWNLKNMREASVSTTSFMKDLYDPEKPKEDVALITSMAPHSTWNDTPGYFVGYSEVVEETESFDGETEGYTRFRFSSYRDPECRDESSVSLFGGGIYGSSLPANDKTPFVAYKNNGHMRGNLLSTEIYDKNNLLKYKEENTYTTQFIKDLRNRTASILKDSKERAYLFGAAYKIPVYRMQLSERKITVIENGKAAETNISYLYNENNLLISEETKIGDDQFANAYTYVGDVAGIFIDSVEDSEVIRSMRRRNMLAYPIEKITYKNGKVIAAEIKTYKYQEYGDFIYPYKQYKLETDAPITDYMPATLLSGKLTVDYRCILNATNTRIDNFGNPLTMVNKEGKETYYLYGYSGCYLVAQIQNTDFYSLKNVLTSFNQNMADSDKLLSKVLFENRFNFRNALQNAHIITYTYQPLIGMTSVTHPDGTTEYFDYYPDGKLKQSYVLKDGQKQIMKMYDYRNKNY